MFAEKGGLRGTVDWMPVEQVASTIQVLTGIRDNTISMLYQVTGMSDIMRGGAMQGGATATEQSIKARFASVRIQSMQDEFARFATDLQRLRASIIVKHYDEQTLIQQSNIDRTPDAQLAQQAIALLKSDFAEYRIVIKSENLSMQDYAAMKQERVEFIGAFSNLLKMAAPVIQQAPEASPYIIEILKWSLGGFKGASAIESVLDQAISTLKQQGKPQQGPPPPDPKAEAQKAKMQADMQKQQAKSQADLQKIAVQTQADMQKIAAKTAGEVAAQKAQYDFDTEVQKQNVLEDVLTGRFRG
jgi:hypothetical protein